jgi:hypothetical protein
MSNINIDKLKSSILTNSINELYPNLIQKHKNILLDYSTRIFQILFYLYIDNLDENKFIYELAQNNFECMKWIVTFLLPYINIDIGNTSEIVSFDDIYKKKLRDIDVNRDSPDYKFSNIQYGRYMFDTNDKIIELEFNEEHIKHNYVLLIDSIIKSSHKMYVNWIDVLPYSLNHLLNGKPKLYLNTKQKFRNGLLEDIDLLKLSDIKNTSYDIMMTQLNSLCIDDIYNTIRNYFYEDIRKVKYLIYDIVAKSDDQTTLIPAVYLLHQVFTDGEFILFNEILKMNKYEDLSDHNKLLFDNKIKLIINNLKNNDDYDLSDNLFIDKTSFSRLFRSIVMSFDLFYRNNDTILKTYIPIKQDFLNKDLDEIKDEFDVSFKYNQENQIGELLTNFMSIKPEYLYEFFYESINKFKNTYYGYCLLNDDKTGTTENMYTNEQIIVGKNKLFKTQIPHIEYVTFKNLYNYAKSISIYKINDGFGKYPRYFQSFANKDKKNILDRLNYNGDDSWFNVKRYLKYTLQFKDPSKSYNLDDYNLFLHLLIREYIIDHVFKCLITKGVLSRFIPNKDITDQSISIRQNANLKLKDNVFAENEKNEFWLDSYYYLNELPYKFSNLFVTNANDKWYTMTAIHWVSQIGFFHHYINNRVMYITGATGVGKSVLVPVLCMYATKAIDYKSISSSVCTQPRTAPTTKNAQRVSQQLGFPIYDNENYNETNNYYVQFKHSEKNHTANNDHLILKYMTDGSLLAELKNMIPIFKKSVNYDKNLYSTDNLYDLIIIDEAHEHNKNMDLLLTLFRDYCYYNPSIKLIILSATMDNDEPSYRRFYRCINDNKKYPITCYLESYKLDRINVDRRYHISPPGVGTRGKITEIYKPGESILNIVNEIIRNGLTGDILIFQPGEGEIISLIKELNKNTPGNIIALPFFSRLTESKKKLIEDIDSKHHIIKLSKNSNFADENVDPTEGIFTYTNFIIIATTIAEASLTIQRLSYVIETGTSKRQIYDYNNKTSILKTLNISESSRLQRKGRVGRVKDGTVYYTYPKGTMENNKILCEVSITNLTDDIYNFLRKSDSQDILFDINKVIKDETFREMYLSSDNKVFSYNGVESHFNYKIKNYKVKMFVSGQYSYLDLVDNDGHFYIVHPDEPNLLRDLGGRIVNIKSTDDNEYHNFPSFRFGYTVSNKIDSFINDLQIMNYITDKKDGYQKTDYGFFINNAIDTFPSKMDRNHTRILIHSVLFFNDINNKLNENINNIVIILAALSPNVLNNDVTKLLTPDDKKRVKIDRLLNIIKKNLNSDIYVMLDIFYTLLNFINKDNILTIENNINEFCRLYNKNATVIKSLYNTFESSDRSERRDKIVENIINFIVDEKHYDYIVTKSCEFYKLYLEFYDDKVIKQTISFIKMYLALQDSVIKLYNPNRRNINYTKEIIKYSLVYKKYDVEDKIIMSFLLGYPYNVVKYIDSTNNYISIYNPQINNIYVIKKLKIILNSKNAYVDSTFINEEYKKNNLLYLSIDVATDSIQCLIYIPESYLKYLNKVYNKDRLNRILSNKQKSIDKYLKKIDFEKEKKIPHTNFEYGVNLYVKSIREIIATL